METRQQRLIRRVLEGDKQRNNNTSLKASLQDKAVEHTEKGYVPRTLTPYEWQEYYAMHGVPGSHVHNSANDVRKREPRQLPVLRRLLDRLRSVTRRSV